ncbi:MAG: thiolase family protein [Actinobacteria bacterium]|nr:thiolase family protein [Actinomycetota bacterium]
MSAFERRSIISGIGQSAVGRRLGRSGVDLTIEASLAAIADAGLDVADIDGLATYPGASPGGEAFSGPSSPEIQDALRLKVNWHSGGLEGPAQLAAVVNAVLAVGAGLANHVLVYRTVTEASAQGAGGRAGIGVGGAGADSIATKGIGGVLQWSIPFRAYSPAIWLALVAQRHFHTYGTTSEQLAQIALNQRRNAAENPNAVYREPLTLDDYFASRMIATPFHLFDCDAPVDGSTAFVVSRAEHASALDHAAVGIESVGTALKGRPSWDQFDDMTTMAARDAGAMVWTRTELTPADVDVAELYDGFSFLTMVWLEALGFCGKGESGAFVEGGTRIALDGALPVNTHGGQLSAGRLHGFGHIHEACVQLRGEGGARQVAGAEVAAVANGGGPIGGAMLLVRER